jgi:hypothetical protein
MGFGEEPQRVAGEQSRLLREVANPHGEDVGPRHARLLGFHALDPYPREAFQLALVLDAESKSVGRRPDRPSALLPMKSPGRLEALRFVSVNEFCARISLREGTQLF